jgi:lipopolysaccharide biosynthesis protein
MTGAFPHGRRARVVAFYLPQFHPIPENDAWWGRGFTEWTNVVRARPAFAGHQQPRLPGHLGFYDLRLPETRAAQADLARAHGVEALCYWHYWFGGRRLLERPFDEVLQSGEPDLPFCLAWANEPWSRRWLGEERDVLMPQRYSAADDVAHARWLVRAFLDPRHLRVDGRPVFLVYRPDDLPEPQRTVDTIKAEAQRHGAGEPYLIGICSFSEVDQRKRGFDATLDWEPRLDVAGDPRASGLKVVDYEDARRRMAPAHSHPSYRTIMVGWDNTARRGTDATIFTGCTPERFEAGLHDLVEAVQAAPPEERLVFVNAWNEWAEGNHLEPGGEHGLGHLEALRRVVVEPASDGRPP